jgi:hypothetical protein
MVRVWLALSVFVVVPVMLVSVGNGAPQTAKNEKPVPAPAWFALVTTETVLETDAVGWRPAFTPDGKKVIDRTFVYDATTGRRLVMMDSNACNFTAVRPFGISPDGTTIALQNEGFRGAGNTEHWYGISLADVATGQVRKTIELPETFFWQIYFPDESRIVAMGLDRAYVIDPNAGKVVAESHEDGKIASLSSDGRLCAVVQFPRIPEKNGHMFDHKPLASSLYEVVIRDMESGKETVRLPGMKGRMESIHPISWTPDSRYIVVAASPRMAVYELGEPPRLAHSVEGWLPATPAQTVQGRYLLVGNHNWEQNALLDLSTGDIIPVKTPGDAKMRIAAIAPDGEHVIVGKTVMRLVPEPIVR